MSKPTLNTIEEFLAVARAVAAGAAPQLAELCAWLVETFDLAPPVRDDLLLEGAVVLLKLLAAEEGIDLPGYGWRFEHSDPDRGRWLALAAEALAQQRGENVVPLRGPDDDP